MKELSEIFRYRLIWLNFLLVILFSLLMVWFNFISLFSFALMINLYDILGYHFALIRRTTQLPEKVIIKAYRIHQLLFESLLVVLLGVLFGWQYSLGCVIIKWFGIQDILYYLFLQRKIPEKFTWMKWTPFGIVKGDLSKNEVIFQSTIGFIIAALIIFI